MSPSRRVLSLSLIVGLGALGTLGALVVGGAVATLDSAAPTGEAYVLEEIPDRFTRVIVDSDAGHGVKAKKEEGRVGKADGTTSARTGASASAKSLRSLGYVEGTVSGNAGLATRGSGVGGGASLLAARTEKPTERHLDHGVSGFFLTETDRLSTFGADVDTASYTQARGKLDVGRLPLAAAVRTEEFVNAFDYDYAAPSGSDAPFAVHLEAAPHPWSGGQTLLRVGVKGAEIDASDAPPVHLTFLVDVSGSMSSRNKLPLVKTALHTLVANLGDDDTVAVVTYAGSTEVLLRPTAAGESDRIHEVVSALRSSGGTDMGSGVELAYTLARAAFVDGHENRVIVLSDGDANIGDTSHTQILDRIEEHASKGVTLTTVGFGTGNYNDALMEQLADKGDGAAFYIDSASEARHRFSTELTSTLRTIAKDVKLQVEFNPEAVHSYRLVGYENRDIADKDFRNDKVDAGEIGSGHEVTALYALNLVDDGPRELATVRVRARQPGPDAPAREWATLVSTDHVRTELADASGAFRKAVAVAGFAERLRGARYTEEIAYAEIYRLAAGAVTADERDQELLALIQKAGSLSGETVSVAQR